MQPAGPCHLRHPQLSCSHQIHSNPLQSTVCQPGRGQGVQQGYSPGAGLRSFSATASVYLFLSGTLLLLFFCTVTTFLSTGNFVSCMVFLWSYSLQWDQPESGVVRLLIHLPSPTQSSFAQARAILYHTDVPVGAELPTAPSTGSCIAPLPQQCPSRQHHPPCCRAEPSRATSSDHLGSCNVTHKMTLQKRGNLSI